MAPRHDDNLGAMGVRLDGAWPEYAVLRVYDVSRLEAAAFSENEPASNQQQFPGGRAQYMSSMNPSSTSSNVSSRSKKPDPLPVNVRFGKKLRLLRLEHKISESELAAQLFMTIERLQAIEAGDEAIAINELDILATIFSRSISDLLQNI